MVFLSNTILATEIRPASQLINTFFFFALENLIINCIVKSYSWTLQSPTWVKFSGGQLKGLCDPKIRYASSLTFSKIMVIISVGHQLWRKDSRQPVHKFKKTSTCIYQCAYLSVHLISISEFPWQSSIWKTPQKLKKAWDFDTFTEKLSGKVLLKILPPLLGFLFIVFPAFSSLSWTRRRNRGKKKKKKEWLFRYIFPRFFPPETC